MAEVDALLSRAHLLLTQGRPKDAEKQLTDALMQDPENDYALSLLGRCKYDRNQYKEGIEIIQRAIRIRPDNGYYFYLLAFGFYRMDSNQAALKSLARAVELNPWAADYFGLWSLILIEEKKFDEALKKANEGLAADAENITCLNARSTALNKLKRVDDAMATMQDALQQDPENDFTHTTIGWNLLEKGKHREASEHFKEALRINPNLPGAKAGLKEALKSKIPPYKWLLQYSFWINNKGKNARSVIPIAIYFGVRLIASSSKAAGNNWSVVGGAIIAIYFLFVATSWIINPLANFFLFFDKDGKYALTSSEKWSAILTVIALLSGISIILASLGLEKDSATDLLISGVVVMSLALPLGHMNYPIRLKGNRRMQWYSIALAATGLVAVILSFVYPAVSEVALGIYGIAFVIYTW